jgi:hypothetical protein
MDRRYDFKNIFAENFGENIGVVCYLLTTASFSKNLIITLISEKNANFWPKICKKSQNIVTITSTPGRNVTNLLAHSISNQLIHLFDRQNCARCFFLFNRNQFLSVDRKLIGTGFRTQDGERKILIRFNRPKKFIEKMPV